MKACCLPVKAKRHRTYLSVTVLCNVNFGSAWMASFVIVELIPVDEPNL